MNSTSMIVSPTIARTEGFATTSLMVSRVLVPPEPAASSVSTIRMNAMMEHVIMEEPVETE